MPEPNTEVTDPFPEATELILFVIVIALVTFGMFPALVYYSVIAYGLFASTFMAVGYLVWLALVNANSSKARGFLVAFGAPVLLVLTVYLFALPWLAGLIVGEFVLFWIVLRLLLITLTRARS